MVFKMRMLKDKKMPKSIRLGHYILAGKSHVLVELQGIEPWSKHATNKLSTCLVRS